MAGRAGPKFGITAELLSREMITGQVDSNPFTRYPILIARMDQLARNDDLLALLDASDWDLIVVDEAHRMSANYYSGELDTTRRYQLGQRLGAITRHLLLMTATPTPVASRLSRRSWLCWIPTASRANTAPVPTPPTPPA